MTSTNASNLSSSGSTGATPANGSGQLAAHLPTWVSEVPQIVEQITPVVTAVISFLHWWHNRHKTA